METRYGRLQVEEDMAFQKRTWKVERAGWMLMALIALASILGLIDKGPLSRARRGDVGTLQLEYERFIHLLSEVRQKWNAVDKWFEGVPMVIVDNGKLLKDRLTNARIDEADILEAARRLRGLENLDQIKYAILEKSGGITIIPFVDERK